MFPLPNSIRLIKLREVIALSFKLSKLKTRCKNATPCNRGLKLLYKQRKANQLHTKCHCTVHTGLKLPFTMPNQQCLGTEYSRFTLLLLDSNDKNHIRVTGVPSSAATSHHAVSVRPSGGTHIIAIDGDQFLAALWHLSLLIIMIVQPLLVINP